MLQADLEAFIASLSKQSREELIRTATDLFCECSKTKGSLLENTRITDEMGRLYRSLEEEVKELRAKVKELELQNQHLTGIRVLQTEDLFGRSTEKTKDIMNAAADGTETADPLDEDAVLTEENDTPETDRHTIKRHRTAGDEDKKHKPHKRTDLSSLSHQVVFDYDIAGLNAEYGEGNWRFAFWNKSETLEVARQTTYVRTVYRPVVSVGLEHTLVALPNTSSLLPKSIVSPSLMAEIYTDRYLLFVTLYRQEYRSDKFGIQLSRQVMSGWCVRFAEELLSPVVLHLSDLLRYMPYQQCDETHWLAIRDGRAPGRQSFVWVHRTSELAQTHQIILFCFNLSRAASHLLEFYSGLQTGVHLTCDCYSGYETFASAFAPLVILSACMMHARRRFVDALKVIDTAGLSDEELSGLPEAKAIGLIQEIYAADEKLKSLTPEERLEHRRLEVKPKVDAFFDYVRTFDLKSADLHEKMRDALQYSVNHEEALRRFLEDGSIPIDNGATERSIRPLTILRRNALFSCTSRGARATMTVFSLIETAKANGAEPYWYLRYLLEVMPSHVYHGKPVDPDSLLPWSPQYLEYEKQSKSVLIGLQAPPGMEKPHTPRKKGLKKSA